MNAAHRANSALGYKYHDQDHMVRRQNRAQMRAVSEANLLDMEPRPRSRHHQRSRSRSRSRIDHLDTDQDDPDMNGFVNHGMDNLMETRAGRLGKIYIFFQI